MKKFSLVVLAIVAILMLSGCADVTNVQQCVIETQAHVYGFWGGLWHGLVSPIAWIGSLFFDDVAIYAVSNNGGWYDFGFGMGIVILFGGCGRGATKM